MTPSNALVDRHAVAAHILELLESDRQIQAQLVTEWTSVQPAESRPQGRTRARIALLWEQHMRDMQELDRLIGAALAGTAATDRTLPRPA